MTKSPAFQFYPGDFLSDGHQMVMELDEVGAYIRLMCVCWKEGSIPKDLGTLARLVRANGAEEMKRIWPALEPCFEEHPDDPDAWVHPRIEKERAKQQARRKKQSAGGRKGAKKRWKKELSTPEKTASDKDDNGVAITKPMGTPMASDDSSSSTSSSTAVKGGNLPTRAVHEAGLRAGAREASSASGQEQTRDPKQQPDEHDEAYWTIPKLTKLASEVLGQGRWEGGELGADWRSSLDIILTQVGGGVSPLHIRDAIRGARLLVDAGEVSWIKPGAKMTMKALMNTRAVIEGRDGGELRNFMAAAAHAWQTRDVETGRVPKTSKGPTRISVEIEPENGANAA